MFTTDWFNGNISKWTKWLAEFKDKPNLRFLEVGCFEGQATVWLLENILTGKDSFIDTIDTFEGSMENTPKEKKNLLSNYFENITPYGNRVFTHKGNSQEVLRESYFENAEYDFIYIDGSHQAPDVLEDTLLCWRKLKIGGVMVWDDYGWHKYKDPKLCPAMAIDAFLNIFAGKYHVIFRGYQVCVVKSLGTLSVQ